MTELFPHFLRAVVSSVMNVLLLQTLTQPKYGKRVTITAMLGMGLANLLSALYCYTRGNLTLLAKLDIVLFTVLCFALKPLFRDSFMQWLFSYVTLLNVNAAIVILSFLFSRRLPYVIYANTALRFLMFAAVIFVLYRFVRPLYLKMVEHWNVFFYVAVAIFISFAYYIVGSSNISLTFTENAVPLLLLIMLAVAAYFSICHSLRTLSREYTLQEENLKMQNNQQLLRLSVTAMEKRLSVMDDATRQMGIVQHDRRHFNGTLLELLRQGQADEAAALLERQTAAMPQKPRSYCENTAVNAAVSYYANLAEQAGISCDICIDIPGMLRVESLELAMALSNLLENAIHACEKLTYGKKRYLRFTCLFTGQLILELENPYEGEIALDENGCPAAQENRHGIGTKSILAFAESHDAQVIYSIAKGVFKVRMLI